MISGVKVPSEVTEDEADVSRPLNLRTWHKDVDDVPMEAVVVDLKYFFFYEFHCKYRNY